MRPFHTILIAVAFIIVLLVKNCSKDREIEDLSFQNQYLTQQTEVFKTTNGKQAARIETLKGEINNAYSIYGTKIDSLEHELDLKAKRIEDLININTETRIDTVIVLDSTGSGWVDTRWLSIGVDTSPSTVRLNALVRDSITFVRYRRGKWYQKKTLTMEGISWSPYTVITGIQDVSIKDNPNKFALVAGTGLTYYDGKIRPVITITFGYKLLER